MTVRTSSVVCLLLCIICISYVTLSNPALQLQDPKNDYCSSSKANRCMQRALASIKAALYNRSCNLDHVFVPSGGSKNFVKGQKTIDQLRPHLSQMRTTKYMPFTRKKQFFEKNKPIGGRPHRPLESATVHYRIFGIGRSSGGHSDVSFVRQASSRHWSSGRGHGPRLPTCPLPPNFAVGESTDQR